MHCLLRIDQITLSRATRLRHAAQPCLLFLLIWACQLGLATLSAHAQTHEAVASGGAGRSLLSQDSQAYTRGAVSNEPWIKENFERRQFSDTDSSRGAASPSNADYEPRRLPDLPQSQRLDQNPSGQIASPTTEFPPYQPVGSRFGSEPLMRGIEANVRDQDEMGTVSRANHFRTSMNDGTQQASAYQTQSQENVGQPSSNQSVLRSTKRTPLAPPSQSDTDGSNAKNNLQSLVTVASSLILVIGLFLGLVWFFKKTGSSVLNGGLPKNVVSVLGRTTLAPKQQLALVQFGSRLVLLSMQPGETRALSEIDDPDEAERLAELCGVELDADAFAMASSKTTVRPSNRKPQRDLSAVDQARRISNRREPYVPLVDEGA